MRENSGENLRKHSFRLKIIMPFDFGGPERHQKTPQNSKHVQTLEICGLRLEEKTQRCGPTSAMPSPACENKRNAGRSDAFPASDRFQIWITSARGGDLTHDVAKI